MAEARQQDGDRISRPLGLLFIGESISGVFFAIAHLGLRIPLGFATLHQPRVIPATVVEMLCGIGLMIAGVALLTHQPWSWGAAIASQAITLAGFTLGVFATAHNPGSQDPVNNAYHRTMLVLVILGLITSITMYRRGHGHARAIEDRRAA